MKKSKKKKKFNYGILMKSYLLMIVLQIIIFLFGVILTYYIDNIVAVYYFSVASGIIWAYLMSYAYKRLNNDEKKNS